MKSSTGQYFIGLDHVRAVAAFIVFTWHFIHVNDGQLAPPPVFPFSILTEGHTGVAIFMVLSGYLFARLLDNRKIIYSQFIWNRLIRLLPLLLVVLFIVGLEGYFVGQNTLAYIKMLIGGIIYPWLPNGGWSITVEFHFYIMLPLLLVISVRWKYALIFTLLFAVAGRHYLYHELGQIQTLSYWTIVGRFDQFVLGILAFRYRKKIANKHALALIGMILYLSFYWYFDFLGGFYKNPHYPSPSSVWVYMPTIEGLAYAFLIAWYDCSFEQSSGKFSRFIASIGTYSYSIYLLHFFVVFRLSNAIDSHLISLSNIYIAMLFSVVSFLLLVPAAYLSYQYVEKPFFRFRRQYIVADNKN